MNYLPLELAAGTERNIEGDVGFPHSSWWGVHFEIAALLASLCPYLTASLLTGTSNLFREKKAVI